MHPSDQTLVTNYLEKGDQQAFSQLVHRHQERIFGYLLGMVRDRSLANDLFQETFYRVIKAMHQERGSYTQQGRWLAWVMRIARNAALDHMRSRKKWQDVSTKEDEDQTNFWNRLPDEERLADDMMHLAQQKDWLDACIEKLPPEQREVLLLRHDAEMTFKEIAALTDCSINTALGRMRYALINLKKMMDQGATRDAPAVNHPKKKRHSRDPIVIKSPI